MTYYSKNIKIKILKNGVQYLACKKLPSIIKKINIKFGRFYRSLFFVECIFWKNYIRT